MKMMTKRAKSDAGATKHDERTWMTTNAAAAAKYDERTWTTSAAAAE